MDCGPRVIQNYDPRATVMQKTAAEVLEKLGVTDPVFDVARELEQIALNDPYFVDKKLYPNVDFYSGIILSAIGFPTTMFRSEEQTSELQSLMRISYAVFCLKKKNKHNCINTSKQNGQ